MAVRGHRLVGIDEVGRGCWAGPLVAGAVVLPPRFHSKRGKLTLRDSKKLDRMQRQAWDKIIRKQAVAIGLGWVWPSEIDQLGLTLSVQKAMQQALAQVTCQFDEVIIDGNYNYLPQTINCRTLVGGDDLLPAISAASVVAKVARDNWMIQKAHSQFPDYGFDKHVGYGTKAHADALRQWGYCQLHRRSFAPIKALQLQLLPEEAV